MEFVIIILFVVLILLLLGLRNSLMERFDRLEREIGRLREEGKEAPAMPAVRQQGEPATIGDGQQPTAPAAPAAPVTPAALAAPAAQQQHPQPQNEQHSDWEKFIGENLVSKIGIAVLVLAIGFFVKYAIDNNWIGPVGRVAVGVLCGGILIGIAHRLRHQYKAFSSVLEGGGLAALYFTIALAYHQYQLFGQTAAFSIMLIITAFSVLLALLYEREELAIIALVGGFVTPFLVSNGRGDYVVLFTYLLILNAGLLLIAYNKTWRLLNILSFGFTALLFAIWLIGLPYDAPAATYRGGWGFGTGFYLMFFIINIAHTIRKNKLFIASDLGILLINTCLYFGAGLYLIEHLGLDSYKGLFCAVMGVFHLGATWFVFRKRTADRNILYLLVGITLSFVSLTAPLQLHGHYITLFWASESVLLYWLYLKSSMPPIRLAAALVWLAMLVSLVTDWITVYVASTHEPLNVVFNPGFMTGLYAAVCCAVLSWLRRGTTWGKATLLTAAAVLFITGALEIDRQTVYYFPEIDLSLLYLTSYTYLFMLLFYRGIPLLNATVWPSAARQRKITGLNRIGAGILVAAVLLYLFSLPAIFDLQQTMLEGHHYEAHFLAHWIGAVIVLLILAQLTGGQRTGRITIEPAVFTWLICLVIVTLLSAEGQLLVNAIFSSPTNDLRDLERIYNKTGLPILWGLCSFAFMWLGMRHKFKPLRIVSLALFSVTLAKLFLFDIRNIPVAGKIAAFFCLGILLLVVSFMYQRLKKIIIEDKTHDRI
jgi:predicted membrane protein DUF2339